jgi:uncharacterized membrane protein YjgN (DUF898 family)
MTDNIAGGGSVPAAGATMFAAALGAGPTLTYDGRLGRLYWLFVKNLLLSIVTFGAYRFWGRTNIRRYIWSQTRFMGDAFEYTGTGSELFAGFLIVVGFFFAVSMLLQIGIIAVGFDSPLVPFLDIVFALAVGYFIFVAQYAAQRYRLTRTVWRGLRGSMSGSAWTYALYAFLVSLLSGATLTLAWPWARARLIERRLGNSYFGDEKVSIAFSARPLYPSYLAGLAAFTTGLAVSGAFWILFLHQTEHVDRVIDLVITGNDPDMAKDPDIIIASVLFLLAVYVLAMLIVALLYTLSFAWFQAASARTVASHARFQELRFSSTATGGTMARLAIGNFLLIVLTAGLATPVVIQRSIRYVMRHLHVVGSLDVERLQQASLAKPRIGEGLLETFDPGLL